MKRDHALIFALLEYVEEHEGESVLPITHVEGHSAEAVSHHLALCREAGFIHWEGDLRPVVYRLSWAGHEALERYRERDKPVFGPITRMSKWLIREVREAVKDGRLSEPFGPSDIRALRICTYSTAGAFLPKHRVGNPGGNTELFVRLSSRPALYRLHIASEEDNE